MPKARLNGEIDDLLECVRVRLKLPPIGERRAIREAANVSKRELAVAFGVSAPTITRWEEGARPRGERAREYVRVLEELSRLVEVED